MNAGRFPLRSLISYARSPPVSLSRPPGFPIAAIGSPGLEDVLRRAPLLKQGPRRERDQVDRAVHSRVIRQTVVRNVVTEDPRREWIDLRWGEDPCKVVLLKVDLQTPGLEIVNRLGFKRLPDQPQTATISVQM